MHVGAKRLGRLKVAGRTRRGGEPEHRGHCASDGDTNAGVVTFHKLDDGKTQVMVQMDYETDGAVEAAGDALGFATRRVKGDLERFKQLIESNGQASGAWRGEVEQDPTT